MNLQSKSRAAKGFLSVVLALSLIVSMVPTLGFPKAANAVKNEEEQITSLNDVEHGVRLPGRERTQEEIEELQRQGCIVDFFDASDIDYKYSANAINAADLGDGGASETLPEKVDLRETNKVTPVKSQGYTNTCWAWGSLAAAETSIANSTGLAATNLSPFQLAYFAFMPLSSNATELKGTEKSQAGEGASLVTQDKSTLLNNPGTSMQAAALMMQGCGPTTESLIPFPAQSLQDGKFYEEDSLSIEQRRQRIARPSKWDVLGSLITTQTQDGQTTYVETDNTVLMKIKQYLASGNAVTIAYFGDTNIDPEADVYFNHATNAQYTYEYKAMNHYVSVVGYDDTYSKDNFIEGHKPEKDGAFICKNSWGEAWGEAGYFYLSYYDQSVALVSTFEFETSEYDGERIDKEEIADQYDYLQLGSYVFKDYDLSDYPESRAWYSNIYTASQKQSLHSIATYATGGIKTLGYRVYKLKSDATTPADVEGSVDSPFTEGEVSIESDGYISVELDKTLNLQEGEKYAIWFYQDAGGDVYHIPQMVFPKNLGSWAVTTVVNEQESFYSCDPSVSWNAMTSNTCTDYPGLSNYAQDNYCVKGYSTSLEGSFFVDFNSNGGTEVDSQVVAAGEKATEPAAPTKEGTTFAGWYKDAALTQPFNFDTDTVSADITLYAAWEYGITYELDGGTNAAANPATYIAGVGVASFADATKAGYAFDGWWSEDGKASGDWGTQVTGISATQTGDVALYAKWSAVEEPAGGEKASEPTPPGPEPDKGAGASLARTGDNRFGVAAAALAVAAAALACACYASKRKSQRKRTEH